MRCRHDGYEGDQACSSTIGLDLVNNILRRPYRDRLRLIVGELGAGLAGRPDDLNDVIRRAAPGLRETSQTLRVLGRQTKKIESLIVDADRVIGALEARKSDVSRFVREAGQTAETTATRREALAAGFRELPAFLGELEPYMGRLGDLAQAQQPVLRDLGAASGDLDTFLTRLRPFAHAGTPAFESLGDASVIGRRAVRESQRGDPGAAPPGAGRARAGQAAAPVPPDDRPAQPRGRARLRAPPPPIRPPPTRPTSRAAAASPAWRRSGTTSTGRRSAPTRSTTSGTCCASGSTLRGCITYAQQDRGRQPKNCNQFLGPDAAGRDRPPIRPHPRRPPPPTPAAAKFTPQAPAPADDTTTAGLVDYLLAP